MHRAVKRFGTPNINECSGLKDAHTIGKIVVLGPKSSGEPYAPDESLAITQVAHGVGVAHDLRSANGALRTLPDAIVVVERMRSPHL